jgi:hypothetical protein
MDVNCINCRYALSEAHLRSGLFTTAATDLRRVRDLMTRAGGSASLPMVDRELKLVERLASMGGTLASYVSGAAEPPTAEDALAVALFTSQTGRGARASALFARAFELSPPLAEEQSPPFRAEAACEAASAGTGQGDGASLDAAARARLRARALGWLREQTALFGRLLDKNAAASAAGIAAILDGWLYEHRIAYVRNLDAVAKLPSDEAAAWTAFWGDVAALRLRTVR